MPQLPAKIQGRLRHWKLGEMVIWEQIYSPLGMLELPTHEKTLHLTLTMNATLAESVAA